MKLGAKLDMVILGRIYAPSKDPKWAQPGVKLTTNNHTTNKLNKNEKNSKLRVFFWLVPLPKDRYRRQAPYADVPETMRLRGAQKQPKMAKNCQKMTTTGRKSIKPIKIAI